MTVVRWLRRLVDRWWFRHCKRVEAKGWRGLTPSEREVAKLYIALRAEVFEAERAVRMRRRLESWDLDAGHRVLEFRRERYTRAVGEGS